MKLYRIFLQAWGNLPVRKKGFVVVALPLTVFVSTIFLTFLANQNHSVILSLLRRSQDIHQQIQNVRQAVAEAEIDIGSYALSGEENWLAGYGRSQTAMSAGPRPPSPPVPGHTQHTDNVHHAAT